MKHNHSSNQFFNEKESYKTARSPNTTQTSFVNVNSVT